MTILTVEQVRQAIYVDDDFDESILVRYAQAASAFIAHKTGYDFSKDNPIHPLAVECAILYVKHRHFANSKYSKEYDFTLGINSLLIDLQIIAQEKLAAEQS